MGLGDPKVPEEELIRRFRGMRVPEGIFVNDRDECVSVEVKRIIGNTLPSMAGGRRHIKRSVRGREHIIWPWTSSVENALSKLRLEIAKTYDIKVHHAVFLIPYSLPERSRRRVIEHITTVATRHLQTYDTSTKVVYHIFQSDETIFDRLSNT
tara:strand:+ start:11774 stop:12232 length:459 start_codon:yes stop_codon:yes gene_type:complete